MLEKLKALITAFEEIEPGEIARDYRVAEENLSELVEELREVEEELEQYWLPRLSARNHHLRFIVEAVRAERDCFAPETKLFQSTFLFTFYVEDMLSVASKEGRLGELNRALTKMYLAAGYTDPNDGFKRGEGPEEYWRMEEEFTALRAALFDKEFARCLRVYRLDEYADLYEQDPDEFAIQREIGRRVYMRAGVAFDEREEAYYRERYGEGVVDRIKERVWAIGGG